MTEDEKNSIFIQKNTEQLNAFDKRIHKLEINWKVLIILAAILIPTSGWVGIQLINLVNRKVGLEKELIDIQEKLKPIEKQYNLLVEKIKKDLNALEKEYKINITDKIENEKKRIAKIIENNENEIREIRERMKYDAATSIEDSLEAYIESLKIPLGSIIAWHNIGNKSKPPQGWVECNGQKLKGNQYIDSPFYNKIIPNLNIGNGNGRYLRGTTGKSGLFQNATLHPYIFPAGLNQLKYPNSHLPIRNPDSKKCNQENSRMIFFSIEGPELEKAQTYYYSSRPISMTVVWIIKVTH
jgi:hypothetical protein